MGGGVAWRKQRDKAACAGSFGPTAVAKIPKGVILLPASDEVEVRGRDVCGACSWNVGEDCNHMIWDATNHHLVALLPGPQVDKLVKLTGT